MADTKISALPASTTPLAGTEVLPIVQSGVTKKTSIESVLTSVQPSGTANGVAYLNGSKVLTSGSALTFDGNRLSVGNGTEGTVYFNGASFGLIKSLSDLYYDGNAQIFRNAAGSSEYMRLTSTGLGIGTSSPAGKLEVVGASQIFQRYTGAASGFSIGQYNASGDASINNGANANLLFGTNNTERARIDSSGNLLIGTTTVGVGNTQGMGVGINSGASYASIGHVNGTASGSVYISFGYNGGAIGNITQNGTAAVAYNTSSDYRLKNTIVPMTGALAKVALLKPCTYKWNADGSDGEGFIAHELAEVVPQCVTGEKDAVDAEGKPVYQGIDTSFLVATLTAAIQELKAEFDAYKASHP